MDNSLPAVNQNDTLMDDAESVGSRVPIGINTEKQGLRSLNKREWFAAIVLCFINLINYMDRFTMAGILTEIQTAFDIGDDKGGLLQTVFIVSYMVFAPIFGYLGDRYNRKVIMAFGIFLWSMTTLLGSFMTSFNAFIACRALVGIGEASYSTIAPTIISDLFIKEVRSKMLALFYFAIPVGSGLGYIVGSETARIGGSWHWALRVTPVLGVVAVLLVCLIQEPPRGHSEGAMAMEATSYRDDLKYLVKNKSFMLSTFGFTCVAFVTGALGWWGPKFIHLGLSLQPGNENVSFNEVAFIFGVLTMLSGLIGVPIGSYLSQRLSKKYSRTDPLLCAAGLLCSTPFLIAGMLTVTQDTATVYILIFFGELTLNINWAIVADMLLYVIIPTRRSTAEAFQILLSHALGDAGSPYLIGVISEALKVVLSPSGIAVTSAVGLAISSTSDGVVSSSTEDRAVQFYALQYALFTTCFVEVLGGLFFLLTALFIAGDRAKAERAVADGRLELSESSGSGETNYASQSY